MAFFSGLCHFKDCGYLQRLQLRIITSFLLTLQLSCSELSSFLAWKGQSQNIRLISTTSKVSEGKPGKYHAALVRNETFGIRSLRERNPQKTQGQVSVIRSPAKSRGQKRSRHRFKRLGLLRRCVVRCQVVATVAVMILVYHFLSSTLDQFRCMEPM